MSVFKTLIIGSFLALISQATFAQSSPIIVGAAIELADDTDLLESPYRITPWLGFVAPIGLYTKFLLGYSEHEYQSDDASEEESRRRLGVELGYTVPLPSLPFVFIQGTQIQSYVSHEAGDRVWYEYGGGVGSKWHSGTGFALTGAIEYRLVERHPIQGNLKDQWLEGQGFVFQVGMEWSLL